jgi:malate dehydrogenase (oxaloacetate-decarboxylating)(NADP+)
MKGADVFLGLSRGGLVDADMVRSMAECPIVFALANPDPEIAYPDAAAARTGVIVATGRSDYPNQVNNVLGFPYIFRGALDVRASHITEAMKVAAARALAALAREPVPEAVTEVYGGRNLTFGPEYLIPTPFDERTLLWVAPAVAEAAISSGVARREIEIEAYRESLRRKMASAAYTINRDIVRRAKRDPRRIVFPEAANPKLLRAAQIIMEDGVAEPVLLGPRRDIEALIDEYRLDLLERDVEIIEPLGSEHFDAYAHELYELRSRRGMTLAGARALLRKTNYFGMMMVRNGHADGLVGGLKLAYPETVRPALQILGLRPGVKVATGMYMMVLKKSVKFFADATINISPDAETLADITVQVSDAVASLGIEPRVAMISFSNFGSVDHPEVRKVQEALARVHELRPDLQVDGEMQADIALDHEKLQSQFPFSSLTSAANVLIFPTLSAGNATYKVLQSLGGAQAVGPILLGISRPVTVLQPHAPVEDIVHMTAYTAMLSQRKARGDSVG